MNAIDMAVIHSQSKEIFIENMKRLGYGVKWIDRYKYITYTTPDGQRFRDNRLFDNKYLKENMEDLYGLKYAETEESVTADKRRNEGCTDRTVQTDFDNAQRGAVQCVGESCDDGWRANCEKHGFSFQIANAGNCDEYDSSIRPQFEKMNKDIVCGRQSIEAKLEKALKEQTRSLEQRLQMERTNLEEQIRARDLSPMKLHLKWMLIGAILPTAYLIWQLIFK